MKTLLTKYWKRILILIAVIFIVINIVNKCVAPHIIVDEYAKYGPDVNYEDSSLNIVGGSNDLMNDVQKNSPFDENMFRIIVLFVILIIGALLLGDIVSKKSTAKKK